RRQGVRKHSKIDIAGCRGKVERAQLVDGRYRLGKVGTPVDAVWQLFELSPLQHPSNRGRVRLEPALFRPDPYDHRHVEAGQLRQIVRVPSIRQDYMENVGRTPPLRLEGQPTSRLLDLHLRQDAARLVLRTMLDVDRIPR